MLPFQKGKAPPPTTGEQLPRRVYIRRSVELAKCQYTNQCIGCQHAKLGLKPADHSEECLARILRQMSVDVDLSQRVQIAQQRMVDRAPPEQPPQKNVRSEDQVEEQTSEAHSTSSSLASIPQNPSSSSTTITSPMQVDESDQDLSKRQKTMPKTDMELEGLDKTVFKDCKERPAVRMDLLQLSVHSPGHITEVFSDSGKVCAFRRRGLTPGFALDLRTGWDLNDPAHRAKVWSHLQQERHF